MTIGLLSFASLLSAVGKAQINIAQGEMTAQTFINLFNSSSYPFFSGGATAAALDNDGYPVQNFTGTISGAFGVEDQILSTTGPWVLSWPAGRAAFQMVFLSQATVTSPVNATVTNGSGSGNPTIVGDAVHAGSVTINWNSTASVHFEFDGTYAGNYANNTSGVMSLVRSSDIAAFNAGIYWTPEIVSTIKNLHPRSLRLMGLNLPRNDNVDSNIAIWAARLNTTSLAFVFPTQYPATLKSGGVNALHAATYNSATGLFTADPASATSLAGWVAGETLITNLPSLAPDITVSGAVSNGGKVQLTVNSTTGLSAGNKVYIINVAGTIEANGFQTIQSVDSGTTFTITTSFVHTYVSSFAVVGYQTLTITGKSGGSKIIFNNLGVPFGFGGEDISVGDATFVYDPILDVVLYTSGGITAGPPIEAQVQLANLVNANLWYNIPTWATDDFITQTANTAYPLLNSNLHLIVEYSNEMWNSFQVASHWAGQRAAVLGLSGQLDWQALRNRQIFGNLLPATSWGGAMSRLERYYGIQGGTGFGDTSITFFMNGTDLAPSGTHTGTGNAAYNTYTGSADYTQSPNRPIDFTDAFGYAPYIPATSLAGQSPDGGSAPLAADAPTLQSIATNYNSGGAGITTAIALIDDAVREGRNGVQNVTASGTTFTTPSAHGFTAFPNANFNLLRFDVTGGTTYSGLNTQTLYVVDTVPTSTTFTIKPIVAGAMGSAVNAGSAGTGTTTVGNAGISAQGSIFNLASSEYTKWESVAASYDASRPAAGLSNLKVEWYEGALEPTAPTAAQCAAIGVTLPGDATGATASAAIASAIVAWKNDASSSATIQLYYSTFMGLTAGYVTTGAMPHSVSPAQLVLIGGGIYGLTANLNFIPLGAYQTYNGFAAFSAP